MNHKLRYSPEALRDLDRLYTYIQTDLQNAMAAEHTVSTLLDTLENLQDFPLIGTPLSSIAEVESNYRFLLSGSYMAFYRVEETDIYIDRILYGKCDYLRILLDDKR